MLSKGGERFEQAAVFMKEGKGNREVSRLMGMSTTTTAKLRRILEKQNGVPFLCLCGRPAVHQGRCIYRKKQGQS
jgi:uncharacterized protein YerC